jgi:O-antigen ligase
MNTIRKYLPLAFLCSFIVSIFFYEMAKAWMSVSMFGMLGAVVFLNPPKLVMKAYLSHKVLWMLSLSCLFLLIYIPLSSNMAYAWNRFEIKVPLLGLALAFATVGTIEKKEYHLLLVLYSLLCLVTAGLIFANFVFSYQTVTESYLRAKVMPSFINHVRYSIIVAMGAYVSYYLYRQEFSLRRVPKEIFLLIAFLLFVFLHVYSVRSGLVAMYGMLTVELLLYVKRTRNYKLFAGAVVVVGIIMVSAVRFVPTLHNKWTNTVFDMKVYQQKGYPNYNSLTTRFISFEGAIAIAKKEPILGCGLGDIKDEMDAFFYTRYPLVDIPILPHNQFLFYLAATGIVGLVLFCITFYFPLFYKRNWQNKILLMQYVVLTLSFMTEPMLETQLGMAYTVLFLFLPLTQPADSLRQSDIV